MKSSNPIQTAFAAVIFLVTGASSFGNLISNVTFNHDGTVTYSYKLDNVGGAFDIFSWSLDFDFSKPDWNPADVFSGGEVMVPNRDWFAEQGVPIQGLSAEDFLALAPGADVRVGQSLGEFSFTSSFLPGPVPYYEFSANGDFFSGMTIGPASHVPESSGPFAMMALMAIMGFAAKTRGQPRSGTFLTD